MNKNQDKGFTLVELLIVIVILGILATVTVFAVRGITDQGQSNACSVETRTLDTALESFYAQNQRDPLVIEELTVGPIASGAGTTADPYVFTADQELIQSAPSDFGFFADGAAIDTPGADGIWGNADDAAGTASGATFVPTAAGACRS